MTVQWRRAGQGAERHRTAISGVTRMSFPRFKVPPPPVKRMPDTDREQIDFQNNYALVQTCREHWVYTALDLVPTFCAGSLSKSTVPAFSSSSEKKRRSGQGQNLPAMMWEEEPVCGQNWGEFRHFPRALPATIWGHCSQILVFARIWGAHKGV